MIIASTPYSIPQNELDLLALTEARANQSAAGGDVRGGYDELAQAVQRVRVPDGQKWGPLLRREYNFALQKYAEQHLTRHVKTPSQALQRACNMARAARTDLEIRSLPSHADIWRLRDWLGDGWGRLVRERETPGAHTPYRKPATIYIPPSFTDEQLEAVLAHEIGHVLLNYRWRMHVVCEFLPKRFSAAQCFAELLARSEDLARMFAASWFDLSDQEQHFGGDDGSAAALLIRQRRVASSPSPGSNAASVD